MPTATEAKIREVVDALDRHGAESIIVLSGVPGTGKTHIAYLAALQYAGHPLFVKQVQFHPAFSYEEFIEGLRSTPTGSFEPQPGVFRRFNQMAIDDSADGHHYVLIIEEFTRANINAVLGELLTYIEYRDRPFEAPYSGDRVSVAPNIVLLATMNPRDRSALEVDEALFRRLRVIDCPPDTDQLREILAESLTGRGTGPGEPEITAALVGLFEACERRFPDTYRVLMPFGHGMFAGVHDVSDLHELWYQRIRHMLERPLVHPHLFRDTIAEAYPWRETAYRRETDARLGQARAAVVHDFPTAGDPPGLLEVADGPGEEPD